MLTLPGLRHAALGATLLLPLAWTTAAPAHEPSHDLARSPPAITVSAQATVAATPDQAQLDVGVVTEAAESALAGQENARRLAAVLDALRRTLGKSGELRTVAYSLTPVYDYGRNGGRPTLTGYQASNTVRVTTTDLGLVGKLIDAATRNGANQIQRIAFTLQDEQAARAQALRKAAQQARAAAEALASALEVRVLRVLSAAESTPPVHPVREVMMAQARAAVATPIESGTIEIPAIVTLTVEIAPR